MHSIKILETNREELLETNTFIVEVTIEVSRDGEVLHIRKLGFDEDATEEEILAKLEEVRANYDAEVVGEARVAKQAEKAKSGLVGLEINPSTDENLD